MRFSYYDRLSAARKKIYRRSDEIVTLGIPPRLDLGATVLRLGSALSADDRAAVQRTCQSLIDALVEGYRVPAVRVRILAKRPADSSGELHGLYEPEEGRTPARITASTAGPARAITLRARRWRMAARCSSWHSICSD